MMVGIFEGAAHVSTARFLITATGCSTVEMDLPSRPSVSMTVCPRNRVIALKPPPRGRAEDKEKMKPVDQIIAASTPKLTPSG
jgi:hypothetical protein